LEVDTLDATPGERRRHRGAPATRGGKPRPRPETLAATTGVEGPDDVAKYLLAGADVVMTASALLRHGPEHAAVLLDGLSQWMARKGFESVDEIRGMLSAAPGGDAAERERAGYVNAMRAANRTPYGAWS
jgi:dihydroorotate dehydrogenase (fumarate)